MDETYNNTKRFLIFVFNFFFVFLFILLIELLYNPNSLFPIFPQLFEKISKKRVLFLEIRKTRLVLWLCENGFDVRTRKKKPWKKSLGGTGMGGKSIPPYIPFDWPIRSKGFSLLNLIFINNKQNKPNNILNNTTNYIHYTYEMEIFIEKIVFKNYFPFHHLYIW